MRPRAAVGAAGALALALVACAGPSRTYEDYNLKAANTAEAAASQVETAQLAVAAASRGKAFGPFTSVVLGQAETDLTSVESTFASVQPPDTRADDVRDELEDLLSDAGDVLSQLRIAVRRGQLNRLDDIARPLPGLKKKLDDFEEAHS